MYLHFSEATVVKRYQRLRRKDRRLLTKLSGSTRNDAAPAACVDSARVGPPGPGVHQGSLRRCRPARAPLAALSPSAGAGGRGGAGAGRVPKSGGRRGRERDGGPDAQVSAPLLARAPLLLPARGEPVAPPTPQPGQRESPRAAPAAAAGSAQPRSPGRGCPVSFDLGDRGRCAARGMGTARGESTLSQGLQKGGSDASFLVVRAAGGGAGNGGARQRHAGTASPLLLSLARLTALGYCASWKGSPEIAHRRRPHSA